jgi:hypothetical protein
MGGSPGVHSVYHTAIRHEAPPTTSRQEVLVSGLRGASVPFSRQPRRGCPPGAGLPREAARPAPDAGRLPRAFRPPESLALHVLPVDLKSFHPPELHSSGRHTPAGNAMMNGKTGNEDGSGRPNPNPAAPPCPPARPQPGPIGSDGFYGSGWGDTIDWDVPQTRRGRDKQADRVRREATGRGSHGGEPRGE